MKRAVILFLLATLLLVGCSADSQTPQEPFTRYVNDQEFVVDPAAQTITVKDYVYTYQYLEDGISITYPNGAVYTQHQISEWVSTGSWSDANFVISGSSEYADEDALLDVVPERTQEKQSGTFSGENVLTILGGIALICVGAWMVEDPHTHWHWNHGWMYKDAEPSDMALSVTGVAGILAIIVGVVVIVIGIFA